MKPLQIGLASPAEVDALWPLMRDGFTKSCAVEPRDYSPGMIWQLCRSGAAYMIVVYDEDTIYMASAWQFRSHECRHTFHCLSLYGTQMRSWLGMAEHFIRTIARENGATRLTACGRSGWLRLFKATTNGNGYEVDI
ncbi:hypothetical protein [Pseudohoeflea coraliihabitans]|uniref:GNAT family N-acetyltransferase n=1 Tax=Pseudohoeflea coraliihabitans TaxID=2860393 RepID=A0ABS6WTD7_9HYPH|nr:hypothetical protein [Pseudohoeflea sp. DP4N28-3]MBW3099232.1 hypothetical protein [Pseudohoeflea sp. DP4N28-3]